MLTIDTVKRGLRDIEGNFSRYVLTHFREWSKWAEQSNRDDAGEEVKEGMRCLLLFRLRCGS